MRGIVEKLISEYDAKDEFIKEWIFKTLFDIRRSKQDLVESGLLEESEFQDLERFVLNHWNEIPWVRQKSMRNTAS